MYLFMHAVLSAIFQVNIVVPAVSFLYLFHCRASSSLGPKLSCPLTVSHHVFLDVLTVKKSQQGEE